MYGSLDISASALVAQRTRLNVISTNVANSNTLLDENRNYAPFRRQYAILAAGDPKTGSEAGVHVASIESDMSDLIQRYDPGSPYADDNGYVGYPNVNPVMEQMNALEAVRSYEANIAAIEATKSMMSIALQIMS